MLPSCPFSSACVTLGIPRHTHPEGEPCIYKLKHTRYPVYILYNKVKWCFFQPAGRFRAGLARPISTPLGSPDGESTGDPPAASLALALAPWPAWRAFKVEKIESYSRMTPPAPPCRAGYVKPALRDSHSRKRRSVNLIQFSYGQ